MYLNSYPTIIDPQRTKAEWKEFFGRWEWDRFVTITFNQPGEGRPLASGTQILDQKKLLRNWDARINRKILGREWAKLHPHWHGLVHFFDAPDDERRRQAEVFDRWADPIWKSMVPSGDVDVVPAWERTGAINYLAKSLTYGVNFELYILPDEFWRS
jgi:hypothetical protein